MTAGRKQNAEILETPLAIDQERGHVPFFRVLRPDISWSGSLNFFFVEQFLESEPRILAQS